MVDSINKSYSYSSWYHLIPNEMSSKHSSRLNPSPQRQNWSLEREKALKSNSINLQREFIEKVTLACLDDVGNTNLLNILCSMTEKALSAAQELAWRRVNDVMTRSDLSSNVHLSTVLQKLKLDSTGIPLDLLRHEMFMSANVWTTHHLLRLLHPNKQAKNADELLELLYESSQRTRDADVFQFGRKDSNIEIKPKELWPKTFTLIVWFRTRPKSAENACRLFVLSSPDSSLQVMLSDKLEIRCNTTLLSSHDYPVFQWNRVALTISTSTSWTLHRQMTIQITLNSKTFDPIPLPDWPKRGQSNTFLPFGRRDDSEVYKSIVLKLGDSIRFDGQIAGIQVHHEVDLNKITEPNVIPTTAWMQCTPLTETSPTTRIQLQQIDELSFSSLITSLDVIGGPAVLFPLMKNASRLGLHHLFQVMASSMSRPEFKDVEVGRQLAVMLGRLSTLTMAHLTSINHLVTTVGKNNNLAAEMLVRDVLLNATLWIRCDEAIQTHWMEFLRGYVGQWQQDVSKTQVFTVDVFLDLLQETFPTTQSHASTHVRELRGIVCDLLAQRVTHASCTSLELETLGRALLGSTDSFQIADVWHSFYLAVSSATNDSIPLWNFLQTRLAFDLLLNICQDPSLDSVCRHQCIDVCLCIILSPKVKPEWKYDFRSLTEEVNSLTKAMGLLKVDDRFKPKITVMAKHLAKHELDLPTAKLLFSLVVENRGSSGLCKSVAALQVLLDMGSLASSTVKRRICLDLKGLLPASLVKITSLPTWSFYLIRLADERTRDDVVDLLSSIIVACLDTDRRAWKEVQAILCLSLDFTKQLVLAILSKLNLLIQSKKDALQGSRLQESLACTLLVIHDHLFHQRDFDLIPPSSLTSHLSTTVSPHQQKTLKPSSDVQITYPWEHSPALADACMETISNALDHCSGYPFSMWDSSDLWTKRSGGLYFLAFSLAHSAFALPNDKGLKSMSKHFGKILGHFFQEKTLVGQMKSNLIAILFEWQESMAKRDDRFEGLNPVFTQPRMMSLLSTLSVALKARVESRDVKVWLDPDWMQFASSQLFPAVKVLEQGRIDLFSITSLQWFDMVQQRLKDWFTLQSTLSREDDEAFVNLQKQAQECRTSQESFLELDKTFKTELATNVDAKLMELFKPPGIWSSEAPLHYMLDPVENDLRMRRKLKINWRFDPHEEAASRNDDYTTEDVPDDSILAKLVSSTNVIEEDDGLLDWVEEEEEVESLSNALVSIPCFLILLLTAVPGRLEITPTQVNFVCDNVRGEVHGYDVVDKEAYKNRSWQMSFIHHIYPRRYLLRKSALEFFFMDKTSAFLHFPHQQDRILAFNKVMVYNPEMLKRVQVRTPQDMFRRSNMTQRWQKWEISNFEYLMWLNTLAGRSYNDLTQYPVFPWVLKDYESEKLDLKDEKIYRDLSQPIGTLNPSRWKDYQQRFESFEDAQIPKFHYGTHYSSAPATLFYLMRLEPFTSLHLSLQSRKFDHPDRLFHSIASCWKSCMTITGDVKELIPEFFYLSEFLKNRDDFVFGQRHDGVMVDKVELPPWCNSPEDFIRIHREALESDYVSENLHLWIDLIFGYKQRGEAAVEAGNVFYFLSYEGAVNMDAIKDERERKAVEDQVHFGQTPSQLLTKPHPARLKKPLKKFEETMGVKMLDVKVGRGLKLMVCKDDQGLLSSVFSSKIRMSILDGNGHLTRWKWGEKVVKEEGKVVLRFYPIYCANSNVVFIASPMESVVRCYYWDSSKPMFTIKLPSVVKCMTCSEDEAYLVMGLSNGQVVCYTLADENMVMIKGHFAMLRSVACNVNHSQIVSIDRDGQLQLSSLDGTFCKQIGFGPNQNAKIILGQDGTILMGHENSDSWMLTSMDINGNLLQQRSLSHPIHEMMIIGPHVLISGHEEFISIYRIQELVMIDKIDVLDTVEVLYILNQILFIGFGTGRLGIVGIGHLK